MAHSYLVRYGLMGRVGRFSTESSDFERGRIVVVRSHRGTELGEILVPAPSPPETDPAAALSTVARVLRAAGADDLERARQAECERAERFAICRRIFEDGVWPLELIDVESMLDDRRTVLHYLGPHRLDASGLLSAFRSTCDLDVVLEPVGPDVPEPEEGDAEPLGDDPGCGSCGSGGGGCGSGGCGTEGASSHGGCSDCGVKKLLSASRTAASR